MGAGGLRAVAERARLVDPGKGSAARTDGHHLDRREADWVAVLDEPLFRDALLAVVDERDVGRGSAHVEPDRVRIAAEGRQVPARDRARRDAGGCEPNGEALGELRSHHPAPRVQEEHVARVAALGESGLQAVHVARDEG